MCAERISFWDAADRNMDVVADEVVVVVVVVVVVAVRLPPECANFSSSSIPILFWWEAPESVAS